MDASPPAAPLIDVSPIYLESAVETYRRGREILARFPRAERISVASHWDIPQLRDSDSCDWMRSKREVLVLGVKKGMQFRPNGRSADFIAPSSSDGCAMACAYCYVARRKEHAKPVSVFCNIEDICRALTLDPQVWRELACTVQTRSSNTLVTTAWVEGGRRRHAR